LIASLIFVLLRKGSVRAEDMAPAALGQGDPSRAGVADGRTSADRGLEEQISANDAQQAQLESETLGKIKLPVNTKKTEVLVKHIRESIHKDASNATNVMRTWISEAETKRTS